MSCDFGVWFPHRRLSNKEAGELYQRLCAGDTSEIQPHPAVDAFYAELTARHPEPDTIPEARVGDHDYCPWSCALDRSASHVIVPSVWSKADYVTGFVHELARQHGLAVYDPQSERITYPDDAHESSAKRSWWRFW
jgi:hypothetical protein